MFDDATLRFFRYVPIAYSADLPNNTAETLPNQFTVVNTAKATDDGEETVFKLIEPDKIELQSNPKINDDSGFAAFLLTKEHRTFDGSIHFTFKMPEIDGTSIMGVFFKFSDQFINQALKIDLKKRKFTLSRNNPFSFKVVLIETVE